MTLHTPGSATTAPQIERVVVIQAMKSTLDDHWYRWLAALLASRVEVVMPAMPTPDEPDVGRWHHAIARAVGPVDAHTLIVAHSVGNAAALQYLTALTPGWSLGGLVNVAGFTDPQPGNDATIPFVRAIDHERILEATAWRQALISDDDPEVPAALTAHLAQQLDSTEHHVGAAGHFRGEDGYQAFPLLGELVLGQIVATDPESTR